MLRNAAALVLTTLLLGLAAGCAGGDGGKDEAEGVRFAVYAAEEQLGDPVDDGALHCGRPRALCPPSFIEPSGTYEYDPSGAPALDESAVAGASIEGEAAEPIVSVELTSAGSRAFAELTKRLAEQGREAERQRHAAVVVGTEIVALAAVDYEAYPDGIQTTQLQFFATGQSDAESLVARIRGDEPPDG